MEHCLDAAVRAINPYHPLFRNFPSLENVHPYMQALIIRYWDKNVQIAKETNNLAISPDQIKKDIDHLIKQNYKAKLIFHGGCLKCATPRQQGIEVCTSCMYSFMEFDKPSKFIPEGEQGQTLHSETIMVGVRTEMQPEEKELRLQLQLQNMLDARSIDLYDQHGNGFQAITISEVMRIFIENGDDILNLANEIRSFREQDKYSCAGRTQGE